MKIAIALAAASLLAAATPSLAQTAPVAPLPPCGAPERHQFDFWIGRWDVYPTGTTKLVAHSLIESVYTGCGIRENWMPLKAGGDGGSLSSYVPDEKGWRQTWVGSGGETVGFTGGWNGSAMVLTGPWAGSGPKGEDGIVRMTYTKGADGSVRQLGEVSLDGGKSWGPSFDFTYRPSNLKTPLTTP